MNCEKYQAVFDTISPYSLPVVSVYLVSVFRLVEYRQANAILFPKQSVRPWFRCWCLVLAVYSSVAFVGMSFPALRLYRDGTYITPRGGMDWRERDDCCFWVTTFFLSKFVELGDTFFIVLMNRPLLLLQWFHHMTTLLYVRHALVERRFSSFWFIYMNLFVHSIMYAYYVKPIVPPWFVTFLQVAQMLIGMSITMVDRKKGFDIYGFTMYGLYFYLFMDYFCSRYIRRGHNKKQT